MLKTLASACVFAMLAFTSTTAHAQPIDTGTDFTFTQPVTLPGVTLPADKSVSRNPSNTTGGRGVQVLSEDGRQSYAQTPTIPAQRFEALSAFSSAALSATTAASTAIRTGLPQTASGTPALMVLAVATLGVSAMLFRWPNARA